MVCFHFSYFFIIFVIYFHFRITRLFLIALKANFDCGKMREKLETTHRHVETLQEEKSRLTDMIEELRLNGMGGGSSDGMPRLADDAGDHSIELLPPLIRQKLVRLEVN